MHRQRSRWIVLGILWLSAVLVQVCQSADVPPGTRRGSTVGSMETTARNMIPTTPISLELRDAEIKDVLRTFGQQFQLNLLVHEESKGLVTVSLRDVPLRDALQTLVDMTNLIIVPDLGGILTVMPVKVYEERLKARAELEERQARLDLEGQKVRREQAEAELAGQQGRRAQAEAEKAQAEAEVSRQKARTEQAQADLEGMKVRMALAQQAAEERMRARGMITQKIDVQYAYDPRRAVSGIGKEAGLGNEKKDLSELAESLKLRLSGLPGSNISVIARANALLVTDTPDKVAEIANLLTTIDVPSISVGIEARIAEIDVQGLEDLGIQWGGVGRSGSTAVLGGGTGAITGTPPAIPQSGGVGLSGSNFIVNLPATLPTTGGASLAFILGRQATKVLDIQLTAVERNGRGRLLARPRVTTPNHERAWVQSGKEIPYLTEQISGGVITNTVSFKTAAIELEVTPHVIDTDPSRPIALDVIVGRREADFANSVQGNPTLISRTLLTRALVKEGETAVIGGLSTDDSTDTVTLVPFLGKIPLLGSLFKQRRTTGEKVQLMIFITPATLSTPLSGAATAPSPASY